MISKMLSRLIPVNTPNVPPMKKVNIYSNQDKNNEKKTEELNHK
jgi:hypothetical protein